MDRMTPFDVHRPATFAEAATLLAGAGARVIAGGTDLLPNLRRGIERPPTLVDVSGIAGIDEFMLGADGLRIGAGVTLARIAEDTRLEGAWQALRDAARQVGAPAHRNAATVGGNLCLDTRCVFYNQSAWWRAANQHCLKRGGTTCHVAPQGMRCHAAFSGDVAPALMVLGAEAEILDAHGTRRLALAQLYRDDGAAHLTLEPGELLVRLRLPHAAPGTRSGYRKARTRSAIDFPLAGIALALVPDGPRIGALRVAMTGTNARPLLLDGVDAFIGHEVDEALLGRLGKLVARQVSPMRTTVTPSDYRRQVAIVLAQRLLAELAGVARTGDASGETPWR